MAQDQNDTRLERVEVHQGEGTPASVNEMADWMLRLLSGGNMASYIGNIQERLGMQNAKEVAS